jgi:GntR family transcriptional regulator, vanillate catabolism transcriptional regulator
MSQTVKTIVRLRELILRGEFMPGERLLEIALVDLLGVSRTPIRAALARLTEEGLLEKTSGGSYAVRAFSERDIHDAIELRGTLEGVAARFAAERGVSPLALTNLWDCIADIDSLLENNNLSDDEIERYLELNASFHQQLVALANSFVVDHILERIAALPFASPNAFVMAQTQLAHSWRVFFIAQEQHRGIVEAIENREGGRAEALAREHSRLSLQILRAALQSKPAMNQIPGMVKYLNS